MKLMFKARSIERLNLKCDKLVLNIAFNKLWRYYEGRGTIVTVFIVCYSLTSFVSG
jgi:hypothetical protein